MRYVPLGARLEAQASTVRVEIMDLIDPDFGISARGLLNQLKDLKDVDRIEVLIHSRGGNAIEGFGIYALLSEHPAEVHVDILGIAASAASVIAMAGDRIRISEAGFVMIHDPWMIAAGNAVALRRSAERLDVLRPAILQTYLRRAKLTSDELSQAMAAGEGEGTWFGSEEALAAGLADEVFEAPPIQNSIVLDDLSGVPPEAMALLVPQKEPEPRSVWQETLAHFDATDRAVLAEALQAFETGEFELTMEHEEN